MATERQRAKKLDKNIAKGKRDVTKVIAKAKRSVSGAVSEYVSQPNFISNAAVRNKLYTEIAAEYKKFNSDISEWTVKGGKQSAKDFFGYAKDDVPKGAIGATFGQFSTKYVEDVIAQINPSAIGSQVAINSHIGGMRDNDIRALRAAVSTTVAEGAVEGLTNPQMAERMLKKASDAAGQFTFIDKSGRRWSADNYFGMLNRTLHSTAARQSYIDAATKEAGFDLYQIEGGVTGSSVDNPEDPCDMWAGRIISMTGETKGYPTYQDAVSAGVFHPMCVHFVRAIMPSEIPDAKKEQREERKEASELAEAE